MRLPEIEGMFRDWAKGSPTRSQVDVDVGHDALTVCGHERES
jgi:hypothetical protein